MWAIHTIHSSAIRRIEILIYATIWMNLGNVNNERRQAQKATYHYMKCPKLAVHRNYIRVGKGMRKENNIEKLVMDVKFLSRMMTCSELSSEGCKEL